MIIHAQIITIVLLYFMIVMMVKLLFSDNQMASYAAHVSHVPLKLYTSNYIYSHQN